MVRGQGGLRDHTHRYAAVGWDERSESQPTVPTVDHALDADAIVSREVFEERPERFVGKVDYVIAASATQR